MGMPRETDCAGTGREKPNQQKVACASMLLYVSGIADDFHDIDLMISERDVKTVGRILSSPGNMRGSPVRIDFSPERVLSS